MGLDLVDLVITVEQELGITIEDLDAEKIGTVGQLYRYILVKLDLGDDNGPTWDRLRAIVSEHAGVARDQITEEKHFVHDFGMD